MTWYGQSQEDRIIWDLVKHLGGTPAVLDIGAFDGTTNSNSRYLIEQGWKAVLIEPSPSSFLELLKLHHGNPKVRLINAAMGMENNLREFHECEGDQCSSFDPKVRDLWSAAGRKYRSYWVPQMTPAMLVNEIAGAYDVISIDAEGSSFDILSGLPIKVGWVPLAIVVEHDSRIIEIAKWGASKGYRAHNIDDQNLILVRV